jgi:hypothetical protein
MSTKDKFAWGNTDTEETEGNGRLKLTKKSSATLHGEQGKVKYSTGFTDEEDEPSQNKLPRANAFQKLELLLRTRMKKKNTSRIVLSPEVKLEKPASSTSNGSSVCYESVDGSSFLASASTSSSPVVSRKTKRSILAQKPAAVVVMTEDTEAHPASSKLNVATLAKIQKKRRLIMQATLEAQKKRKK